jgi:putative ABC transport system substrate-binding protein
MRRREFISILGAVAGTAVVRPQLLAAQPSPIRPLVGVLSPLSMAAAARNIAALRSSLRDLGYIEGRSLTLALLYGDGVTERLPPLASELVALNPDVILAGAQTGALAARGVTTTIPIVTIILEDPVVSGFASSIAKPGGNITGTWILGDSALVAKGLDFLKLAVPGFARVGALFNPDDPNDRVSIPLLPAAAPRRSH